MLAGAAIVVREPVHVAAFTGASRPGFGVVLALVGSMGVFINHATMACTRANDALTTNVIGSAKNIVMTVVGMVAFGDFVFAPWNVVGLILSAGGTLWYATANLKVRREGAGRAGGDEADKKGTM